MAITVYNKTNHQFLESIKVGNLELNLASCPSIEEIFPSAKDHEASIRMGTKDFILVSMYRLPEGQAQLKKDLDWYSGYAIDNVKLPDGVPFISNHLRVRALDHFEHKCFATSKRSLFHLYSKDDLVILMRFAGDRGTMLDKPIFLEFLDNIKFDNDWQTRIPKFPLLESRPAPESIPSVDRIDLAEDMQRVSTYLRKRVATFGDEENYGPGDEDDPITQITLGYQWDQSGWVAVVFDTRPNAEMDQYWQGYLSDAYKLDHWYHAFDTTCSTNKPITVVTHKGKKRKIRESNADQLDKYIGKMLTDVLVQAREEGVFATLPLADSVRLCIEEHECNFGWEWEGKLTQEGQ